MHIPVPPGLHFGLHGMHAVQHGDVRPEDVLHDGGVKLRDGLHALDGMFKDLLQLGLKLGGVR